MRDVFKNFPLIIFTVTKGMVTCKRDNHYLLLSNYPLIDDPTTIGLFTS